MARHVLVPFDASEQSTRALEWALEAFPDADLTVLHVIDPGEVAYRGMERHDGTDFTNVREEVEGEAEELLDRAREVAGDHGREVATAIDSGDVAEEIVERAAEDGVDHIVVGTHGRTGASRVLLGSTAETVARRSTVPVTIV